MFCRRSTAIAKGSPPQVRGKLSRTPKHSRDPGITPAGAGKTDGFSPRTRGVRDHPRRCGENVSPRPNLSPLSGSPPQVRGKLSTGLNPCSPNWDHPRRCGENQPDRRQQYRPAGSPPQVRGKLLASEDLDELARITPAGAGKTRAVCRTAVFIRDHPRRCGENNMIQHLGLVYRGSPPQVRGKPASVGAFTAARRITPAGAGKTSLFEFRYACCKDHPRRCGENA